ncbi:PRC-barrel domain-containing protein [Salinithrix halophila]|uniref:PRC-barrel domain-containing protein n=1 Tax=Salinithrix halophila TaxID=1485204 RepID=A0ABV8JFT4_9BACL
MLVSAKGMEGTTVVAVEGEIGKVDRLLIDDETWTVRYLIVNVGSLFHRQRVLISPIPVKQVDWEKKEVRLSLTREQVKDSPDVDAEAPISRKSEVELHRHYGWPVYWGGAGLWGGSMVPGNLAVNPLPEELLRPSPPQDGDLKDENLAESRLLSVNQLTGFTLKTHDGELGQVDDFIIDDHSWTVRFLVVDAGSWLSSKKVMIDKDSVEDVDMADARVHVDLVKDNIKGSPEYEPSDPINEEGEKGRFDYYGRPR